MDRVYIHHYCFPGCSCIYFAEEYYGQMYLCRANGRLMGSRLRRGLEPPLQGKNDHRMCMTRLDDRLICVHTSTRLLEATEGVVQCSRWGSPSTAGFRHAAKIIRSKRAKLLKTSSSVYITASGPSPLRPLDLRHPLVLNGNILRIRTEQP